MGAFWFLNPHGKMGSSADGPPLLLGLLDEYYIPVTCVPENVRWIFNGDFPPDQHVPTFEHPRRVHLDVLIRAHFYTLLPSANSISSEVAMQQYPVELSR